MLQHAKDIAPSVSWEILHRIKRSCGLSVNELAAEMKMSYMGVKQHCDDLKKRGYLDTMRRAKGAGRPEKMYQATDKLDAMLPHWDNDLSLGLLGLIAQMHGDAAPEKLMHAFLQHKMERWFAKLKGEGAPARAVELVKLRNADGWINEVRQEEGATYIMEHHSPMNAVARLYPSVSDMETRMIAKLLGCNVERRQTGSKIELWLA